MNPAPRTRTRGELRREEIRKAAYRCFQKAGYHETTVDDICALAGLSKGSFYWSYSSKQEVFIDILETWAREVMDELHEQFEAAVHQPDYVAAISAALERETTRGRLIVPLWLEFTIQARKDEEIRASLSKFYRRARTAIAEILRPVVSARLSEDELQASAAGNPPVGSGGPARSTVAPAASTDGAHTYCRPMALLVSLASPTTSVASGSIDSVWRPPRTVRA